MWSCALLVARTSNTLDLTILAKMLLLQDIILLDTRTALPSDKQQWRAREGWTQARSKVLSAQAAQPCSDHLSEPATSERH